MKVEITRSNPYVQAQQIATGRNVPMQITVDVDPAALAETTRRSIVEAFGEYPELFRLRYDGGYNLNRYSTSSMELRADVEPEAVTPELVSALIHGAVQGLVAKRAKYEAEQAERAEEKRAKAEQQAADRERAIGEFRSNPAARASEIDSHPAYWIKIEGHKVEREHPQFEEIVLEAVKRAKADREQQESALRAWAIKRGSERLREMLDLGVGDWVKVAREEFFETEAPNYGGTKFTRQCWQESGDCEERKKPTLEELRALRAMRDAAQSEGSVISDPELQWCVINAATDPETGDESPERRFCVLRITMTAPDGDQETLAIQL